MCCEFFFFFAFFFPARRPKNGLCVTRHTGVMLVPSEAFRPFGLSAPPATPARPRPNDETCFAAFRTRRGHYSRHLACLHGSRHTEKRKASEASVPLAENTSRTPVQRAAKLQLNPTCDSAPRHTASGFLPVISPESSTAHCLAEFPARHYARHDGHFLFQASFSWWCARWCAMNTWQWRTTVSMARANV